MTGRETAHHCLEATPKGAPQAHVGQAKKMISKRQWCEWSGIHRQVIKVKAHHTTLLAVVWALPSMVAVVVVQMHLLLSVVVWTIQVVLIAVATHFWRTEEKRRVTVLERRVPRRLSLWIDRVMNRRL